MWNEPPSRAARAGSRSAFRVPVRCSSFVLSFAVIAVIAVPRLAWAQAGPQITVQADVDKVAVGDVLHLALSATSTDAMPTAPDPGATPGFVAGRPNTAPSQMLMNINGARSARYTLSVDWPLQAQRAGTFTLGPPSVIVGGARFSGRTVIVQVVPAGQATPRRGQPPSAQPGQQAPFSPFDPWRGLFPGVAPPQEPPIEPVPTVTTDPALALDVPRGLYFFLHAKVDHTNVVVGEQVLFSTYTYLEEDAPSSLDIDGQGGHEATAPDFIRQSLMRDDNKAVFAGFATVGGHVWKVALEKRWALFPLHAGDLTIGPMSVNVTRPSNAVGERASETIRIHVTEPPLAGRPPGYALGDVGRFTLAAQVTPRDVEQGAAIGVHVELSGSGNLPAAIAPPVREGVEWLAPEVHAQLGTVSRDVFGGRRTFDYVVRMLKQGDVDLGSISLPFWDPEQRRYDVARVVLGTVRVRPSAAGAAASSAAAAQELLPGLPAPRDALSGSAAASAHLDDSPLFWILGIGAWPAAFATAVAGRAAGRRVAGAWRARRASPLTELKERVGAADAASSGKDARAADAATARALEAAAVALAGVSVRGAVGDEIVDRLAGAGVERGAATSVADLLRECESARFSPDAADVPAARDRWMRARGAIRGLEKR